MFESYGGTWFDIRARHGGRERACFELFGFTDRCYFKRYDSYGNLIVIGGYTNMTFSQHPKWYKALHALHFGFGGGLLYVTAVGVLLAYAGSPVWLRPVHASGYGVFSATSFWNTRIPRYPMANANSAGLVLGLVGQIQSNGSNFDTTDGASVYMVDTATPVVSVVPIDCGSGIDSSLAGQWQSVPVPFYATSGAGTNHRMVIYQASSGTIWEFDHMQKIGSQWQACHGGQISAGGNGVFGGSLGVMGSGLALLGGQVSVADLKRGVIGHAIGISLPSTGGVSWPAVRSDGAGGQISQGMRLQLDPAINVDALGLSPVGRMIAKTAQTYGFVVWGTSSSVSILGESPLAYTVRGLPNPYSSIGSTSLGGFPWDKLRVLPPDYGQGGETPSILKFTSSTVSASAGQQIGFSWEAVNVDECAIPGVAGHLGASGSATGYDLHSDTAYVLTCSGPGGSISRNVAVSVSGLPATTSPAMAASITIDLPLSGIVTVLPQFDFSWAAKAVYKTVYYEHGSPIQTTTTPPFALDTTKVSDGPHELVAQIYFRDGHQESQNVNLKVRNHAQRLVFAGPLSASTPASPWSKVTLIMGMTGMFLVMTGGFWYGWRRLHPRSRRPLSWLVSYV